MPTYAVLPPKTPVKILGKAEGVVTAVGLWSGGVQYYEVAYLDEHGVVHVDALPSDVVAPISPVPPAQMAQIVVPDSAATVKVVP